VNVVVLFVVIGFFCKCRGACNCSASPSPCPGNIFNRCAGGLFILTIFLAGSAPGQILMSGGTYSQNFDSLASSGTAIGWTNNVTLPAWYASRSVAPNDVTSYNTGTGSSITGSLYSFGSSSSSERALGSVASGTSGNFAYGVRFANDTGTTQTNFLISYTGEQWRVANTTAQKLLFYYQVGSTLTNADAPAAQNWTAIAALDFVSPNTNATQALIGNAATNQLVFTNMVLAGVMVPAGQELFLRWFDANDAGLDDGMAIDNLTVTFGDLVTNVASAPDTNIAFSLLTYNVNGNGATDWSTNAPQVQAIGRQLQYLQPDIVTFQEIPFDLSYEMTNFVNVYLPGYALARNSGTDGSIRSVIASRFPITRSTSWLDGIDLRSFGYSNANNSLDNFTRDLFEAQISVPGFPQPFHVFTTHLKSTSGTTYADASAKRAAEASAITNFFATNLFLLYPLQPYVLTGDMNDSDTNALAIQRLISALTGLRLTNPKNPVSGSINTFSIQGSLSGRIDFIFPNELLFSNIRTSQVFRTDLLNLLPPNLNAGDDSTASDHLPVLMVFNNPYTKPFQLASVTRSNQAVALKWESVPGQFYQVETSSNLTAWSVLASGLTATNYVFTFTSNSTEPAKFFRVRQSP
jgi:endonuclease/exonuclease/phosphatase family metal-dependent hydrolase